MNWFSEEILLEQGKKWTQEYRPSDKTNIKFRKASEGTFNQEVFLIFRRPIHMSVSSIWVQVCETKGRSPPETASFKQVELLQFLSS